MYVRNIILNVCVAVLAIGCSSTISYPPYSGFLKDYTGLYRSDVIEGAFISDNPRNFVKNYSKYYIAPVAVYLLPDAEAYSEEPLILKSLALEFQNALWNALSSRYTVVDQPGEGVLILKFALTDFHNIKGSSYAKVLFEAEFLDGQTGERIMALVYGHKPKTFKEWGEILVNRLEELKNETKIY